MTSDMTMIKESQLFKTIKDAKENLGFTLLLDITAIDNLNKAHPSSTRFELVYVLRHSSFENTMIFKVAVEEPEIGVATISSLFSSADWAEREVYDQYGVNFIGHKTLKRLLNHNEFVGHPL